MLKNKLPLLEIHFFPCCPRPFFCLSAIIIPNLLFVFRINLIALSLVLFTTLNLNVEGAVPGIHGGLGLNIISDQIGYNEFLGLSFSTKAFS